VYLISANFRFRKLEAGIVWTVAARSKAWVCGHSPADSMGSNPAGGHGCLSVVSVVY